MKRCDDATVTADAFAVSTATAMQAVVEPMEPIAHSIIAAPPTHAAMSFVKGPAGPSAPSFIGIVTAAGPAEPAVAATASRATRAAQVSSSTNSPTNLSAQPERGPTMGKRVSKSAAMRQVPSGRVNLAAAAAEVAGPSSPEALSRAPTTQQSTSAATVTPSAPTAAPGAAKQTGAFEGHAAKVFSMKKLGRRWRARAAAAVANRSESTDIDEQIVVGNWVSDEASGSGGAAVVPRSALHGAGQVLMGGDAGSLRQQTEAGAGAGAAGSTAGSNGRPDEAGPEDELAQISERAPQEASARAPAAGPAVLSGPGGTKQATAVAPAVQMLRDSSHPGSLAGSSADSPQLMLPPTHLMVSGTQQQPSSTHQGHSPAAFVLRAGASRPTSGTGAWPTAATAAGAAGSSAPLVCTARGMGTDLRRSGHSTNNNDTPADTEEELPALSSLPAGANFGPRPGTTGTMGVGGFGYQDRPSYNGSGHTRASALNPATLSRLLRRNQSDSGSAADDKRPRSQQSPRTGANPLLVVSTASTAYAMSIA